jgi:hypothetical protein
VSQQLNLKKVRVICQKFENNREIALKKRNKIIEGQKLITHLLKHRGNRGRRESCQIHLKKQGVISQKSENNNKKAKKGQKKRNK